MGNLHKLKELVLANNQLNGEIPEEFDQLASLQIFQIQNNHFESIKNLDKMNSEQFLVFDFDAEDPDLRFEQINTTKTRMADTKFEDVDN